VRASEGPVRAVTAEGLVDPGPLGPAPHRGWKSLAEIRIGPGRRVKRRGALPRASVFFEVNLKLFQRSADLPDPAIRLGKVLWLLSHITGSSIAHLGPIFDNFREVDSTQLFPASL